MEQTNIAVKPTVPIEGQSSGVENSSIAQAVVSQNSENLVEGKKSGWMKWVLFLLGILIVLGVIGYWIFLR